MPSSPPTFLNLIFHGPWGFVRDGDSIVAATPSCQSHVCLLGDTPVLYAFEPGQYRLQDPGAVAPVPPPNPASPSQTIVAGAVPMPVAGDLRLLRLPRTGLRVGRRARRTPLASHQGDGLLTGASFSRLNCSSGQQTVYLAVNQVLPYTIRRFDDLGIVSGSKLAWRPARDGSRGRTSVNLHLFGQSISASATSDHFAMMAALFGLDLRLDGPDARTEPTDFDANLPVGVTAEDLGDLGAEPAALAAPQIPTLPIICGGGLVMSAA